MRILFLTTYRHKVWDLANCNDRDQIMSYYLYKYLSNKDIDIEVKVLPHRTKAQHLNKMLKIYEIEPVDHVIAVQDKAFYKRVPIFIRRIGEKVTGAITSIGTSNVYSGGEDILFYTDDCCSGSVKHSSCIQNFTFPEIIYPNQSDNEIIIAIQYHKYNKQVLNMVTEFKERNKDYLTVNIMIDGQKTINDKPVSPIERYETLAQCNVYFFTKEYPDCTFLYDLKAMNVLPVLPTNKRTELIDEIKWAVDIPWRSVIQKLNDEFVDGIVNQDTAFDKLWQTLLDFKPEDKRVHIPFNLIVEKKILRLKEIKEEKKAIAEEKKKEVVTKKANKVVKRKKNLRVLQSSL